MRLLLLALAITPLHAAVIGTSTKAPSITAERLASLPLKQRAAWTAYLQRSDAQRTIDRATLAAERSPNAPEPALPRESSGTRSMNLHEEAAHYAGPEGRHIADVILSFQTPAGGWSKNLDMNGSLRAKGQSYTPDNLNKHPSTDDFDAPRDPQWNYVGTLDNDATTTELRYLALVSTATPGLAGEPYRASFLRGIRYLLKAQFPNGGWPQVWPLEGGYHDAITFNDNSVTDVAELLSDTATGQGDYAFVPADLRRQSAAAAARALDCILTAQIVVAGKRTVWAQQHDALTFQPVPGRNYEPAALSSGESADLLCYLMRIAHPTPAIVAAIRSGIVWLQATAIQNQSWLGGRATPGGRHLEAKPGAPLLWARFYSIETGKPVFGDRDKSIHDDVSEISLERRNGYAWYSTGPQSALDAYAAWTKTHPSR